MNTLQRVVFEVVDDCLRFSERLINCLSNYDNRQRQRMNCFSIVRCWCGKYEQIPACTPKTLKPLPPLWFLMFFVSFQFTMNQGMRVWICLLQSSHTHTHIHMQLDTLNHYLLSHNFGHHSEQIHIFIFTNMRLSLKIFDSFDTIWFAYFGIFWQWKIWNKIPKSRAPRSTPNQVKRARCKDPFQIHSPAGLSRRAALKIRENRDRQTKTAHIKRCKWRHRSCIFIILLQLSGSCRNYITISCINVNTREQNKNVNKFPRECMTKHCL